MTGKSGRILQRRTRMWRKVGGKENVPERRHVSGQYLSLGLIEAEERSTNLHELRPGFRAVSCGLVDRIRCRIISCPPNGNRRKTLLQRPGPARSPDSNKEN